MSTNCLAMRRLASPEPFLSFPASQLIVSLSGSGAGVNELSVPGDHIEPFSPCFEMVRRLGPFPIDPPQHEEVIQADRISLQSNEEL